ncbi:MAG: hypothetical protein ACHQIG_10310 [Acidimicrobiia bacterium]
MNDSVRVTVVCTANQCRSPLAAAILGRELERAGVAATVGSVGTEATGDPATPGTVIAARRLGLDLGGHVGTRLDPAALADASLVLAMERRHVQDVVIAVPDAFPRTFTLKELVRRAAADGPRLPTEALPAWLARVGSGRRPADLLGQSPLDDIADPTVDPLLDHDALATELTELVEQLVALAWPRSG